MRQKQVVKMLMRIVRINLTKHQNIKKGRLKFFRRPFFQANPISPTAQRIPANRGLRQAWYWQFFAVGGTLPYW